MKYLQFLIDSVYDLLYLKDTYGQQTLGGWWESRKYEWEHLFC